MGEGKAPGNRALSEISKGRSNEVWVHRELEGRESASCFFPVLSPSPHLHRVWEITTFLLPGQKSGLLSHLLSPVWELREGKAAGRKEQKQRGSESRLVPPPLQAARAPKPASVWQP